MKRKTDINSEVENKITTPVKNQFEEENIFLLSEKTKEKTKKSSQKEASQVEENKIEEEGKEKRIDDEESDEGENIYEESEGVSTNVLVVYLV